jgi:hypothetical protein
MQERGVRMPGDRNPVAKVGRYRESAPEIRFLTLEQIEEQLRALADPHAQRRPMPSTSKDALLQLELVVRNVVLRHAQFGK